MHWYSQKMYFFLKSIFKSKLKKPVTQCPMAKSKKTDLWWWKNTKSLQKIQNCPPKKFPGWFGHKTSEPNGFPDNFVFIQRKLIFSEKKLCSKLTLRWSDTPWCIFDILSSFWVHWDTLAHQHIISRSYGLHWWSGWVWSAEQSLFVWAALFFFYTPFTSMVYLM